MEKKTQITYIVVGDCGTGKTSLLNHFFCDGRRAGLEWGVNDIDGQLLPPEPTMGVDYRIKSVLTQRYGPVEFLLRDTSGMERYNSVSLTQTFYRGAEAVMLVFDVTRRQSFDHIADVWVPRLRAVNTMHPQCRYMLVGNKTDLVAERQVSREDGIALAHQCNMDYCELSSLQATCAEIREPFMVMAAHLIGDGVCRCKEYPVVWQQHQSGVDIESNTCCDGGH